MTDDRHVRHVIGPPPKAYASLEEARAAKAATDARIAAALAASLDTDSDNDDPDNFVIAMVVCQRCGTPFCSRGRGSPCPVCGDGPPRGCRA